MNIIKIGFLVLVILVSFFLVIGSITLSITDFRNNNITEFVWYLVLTTILVIILVWAIFRLVLNIKSVGENKRIGLSATNYDETDYIIFPQNETLSPEYQLTIEEKIIQYIKQFQPSWRNKNGKKILEGGENGNNANLASFLRDKGIQAETEEILRNGSRVDILINKNVVVECKPQLLSTDTMHKLSGEVKRTKKISNYRVLALIYGDARKILYEELCEDINRNDVIVLGQML
jgi:hypothetical protein